MATQINTLISSTPPVVADFGWYYGSVASPGRLPEFLFTVDGVQYAPGVTTLSNSTTLPTALSIPVASTATLESSGSIVFYGGLAAGLHTTAQYTVVDGSHITCVGGSGTFAAGTPIFDPRFYVDSIPANTNVIFDAVDFNNLGLPTVQVPSGVSIISYRWDFGNGSVGVGPYASTIYNYGAGTPSLIVKLTVIDNFNRMSSCSHRIAIQPTTGSGGLHFLSATSLPQRSSNLGFR